MRMLDGCAAIWAVVFCMFAASARCNGVQVVKKVFRARQDGRNLLRPDGWRAWGKGFERQGDVFVCDNADDASVQRGVSQTVVLNQRTPIPIVAEAESRAENVGGSRGPDYSLYLDIIYMDGTPLWGRIAAFSVGTHDWQRRKVLVVPDKPIKTVTVHLLLRRHTGRALFRNPRLVQLKPPSGLVLFDGVPVTVERTPEAGFEVRDVARNSDFVRPGPDGKALGLLIRSRTWNGPAGSRFTDVVVEDLTGKDRAVSLVWARRLPEGETVWFQDPRRSMGAAPGREYMWTGQFHAGANGRLSRYPFATVAVNGRGYGMGIDAAFPAFFRVGYHHGTRQLFLVWDLGFASEQRSAHVRFCEFSFESEWGFRAAVARWYRIFPDYFRCRTPEQGLWMPFARISKVEGWQDFGFKFKEGNNETEWDDAHGIITFRYTEPMTWWMPMRKDQPRTLEAALAEARRLAALPREQRYALQARALFTSGMFDDAGRYACLFRDTPWCNGVVWSMNSMPGISGEVTDFKIKWNPEIRRRLYGPERKGDLDGEYVDSSEGYVTSELDFRRDHFRGARTPLVLSWENHRPAIFRGLVAFEYVRALARDVHGMGKLMMANSTPIRLCWLAPFLDVMGTETNWNHGGKWRPMSDQELLYRRVLCGPKPYCFLMNTDFSKFSHTLVEKYMMRAVAYGMFPGFFSANASTGHYFTRPELYNRDRPLFKKYIPICKRLAEAGWQPITKAWTDSEHVYVERFGERLFTLFNDGSAPATVVVTLAISRPSAVRDLVSGRAVPWQVRADGRITCTVTLPGEHLAVLDVQSAK